MECSQIRAILLENTDTEIPVEFRENVEAHLAVCRPCAMQFEALREQSRALGTLPRVEAPMDFLEQLRSRVEKPSFLSRLKQGLPVLFAWKRFFQLAGAAATALVLIAAAQVILRDGGRKALLSPSPPSVITPPPAEAPPPVKTPPSVEAPPAAPWKNGKEVNRAALPQTAPHRPAGVETQSVLLTLKLPGASPKGKSRGGASKPESFSASSPAAGGRAQDERRLKQDVSEGAGGFKQASKVGTSLEKGKILSEVRKLISRANGKILSAEPAKDENQPGALLAEMPAADYPSFLDQLSKLAEVEVNGDKEFSHAPDSKVRVSVSFDTRD